MKKYINPELEIKELVLEMSIMNESSNAIEFDGDGPDNGWDKYED